jgi:hypothetical protein
MSNQISLSEEIRKLKGMFAKHPSGVTMNTQGVSHITDILARMERRAMLLETSNKRWAGMAEREHGDTLAILNAVKSGDPKVVLFPVIPRPAFHGSGPKGAA